MLNVFERRMENMETSHHSDCDRQRKLKELVYLTLSHSTSAVIHSGQRSVVQPDSIPKGPLWRHHFPKAIITLLLQQIMMKENKKERRTERHFNKE